MKQTYEAKQHSLQSGWQQGRVCFGVQQPLESPVRLLRPSRLVSARLQIFSKTVLSASTGSNFSFVSMVLSSVRSMLPLWSVSNTSNARRSAM